MDAVQSHYEFHLAALHTWLAGGMDAALVRNRTFFREKGPAPHPSGGRLVLTFRDYASREAQGVDRFIPARADESRIFTCFPVYHAESVLVHDLLHERGNDGAGHFRASSYPKLRLDPGPVRDGRATSRFRFEHESTERGLLEMVAIR